MNADIGLYRQKYALRAVLVRVPGVDRLSPNALSLAAFVPGALAALCVYEGCWLWAIAAIVARMIVSTLDGLVAEEFGKATRLGAYLNRVPGEVNDILIAGALWPHAEASHVVTLVALTGLVQMFGTLGVVGGGRVQSVGPCGQTDRLVIVGAGCALAAVGLPQWSLLVHALLLGCIVTIVLRVYRTVSELQGPA